MSVKSTPPRVPLSVGAERVLLHKGTWKPKGATATAYIWLVWVKGMAPLPPFWIPPGQRKALTHDDDLERFTTSPIAKKLHAQEAVEAPIVRAEGSA
jgi:hypothetical protein